VCSWCSLAPGGGGGVGGGGGGGGGGGVGWEKADDLGRVDARQIVLSVRPMAGEGEEPDLDIRDSSSIKLVKGRPHR